MLACDVAQLFHEVHFQRAANATVLQGHEALFLLPHDSAFLYQIGINVHFANIVDDDSKLYTSLIIENTIQQRGLSAAQITREQQNGYFFHFHKNFLAFCF